MPPRPALPCCLALLLACGSPEPAPAAPDAPACDPTAPSLALPDLGAGTPVLHLSIPPTTIDPASDRFPTSHHQPFVADAPAAPRRDELLLLLPGTSNQAQAFQRLGALAARAGFPVIVLAYDSEIHPASYCGDPGGPAEIDACRTAVFLEKIYGVDTSDRLAIDAPNAIVGRAVRLLAYLDAQRPELGASRFYAGAELRWDRIVIAGFSQGAGMAGRLSTDHAFARAVLLAGGCDVLTDGDGGVHLASWCTAPRATPASATFAIRHTLDSLPQDAAIHAAFGLDALGPPAHAPSQAPGYCTSTHILETDLPSQDGGARSHLSVAHDDFIPVDADGVPVLAEDYAYAFTGGAP